MKLYEIEDSILALVDEETGEITNPELFDQLNMEREKKLESLGLWVKDMRAEAKAIRAEEKNLKARREALERRAESVKAFLMAKLGGEKFRTPRVAITWRKVSSVSIPDPEAFIRWAQENGRDDLLRYSEPEISKVELRAALASGEAIEGAELVHGQSMQIK